MKKVIRKRFIERKMIDNDDREDRTEGADTDSARRSVYYLLQELLPPYCRLSRILSSGPSSQQSSGEEAS